MDGYLDLKELYSKRDVAAFKLMLYPWVRTKFCMLSIYEFVRGGTFIVRSVNVTPNILHAESQHRWTCYATPPSPCTDTETTTFGYHQGRSGPVLI